MIIGIASDHAGFKLKNILRDYMSDINHIVREVKDFGCDTDEYSVDYPDYANLLIDSFLRGDIDRGILICGSGIGMSIAANRNKKIRAALCHDLEHASLCREHNDANVLCLGARKLHDGLARGILTVFLQTEFAKGRHVRRIDKL